ncbi:TolC family protein [Terriglobus sp. 2YAB30_2]|uniref:TolC family protein n=1 Tax=Terriglobus sp. 2YAB30_2 TaxID=3233023 RepID=UPI003F97F42A
MKHLIHFALALFGVGSCLSSGMPAQTTAAASAPITLEDAIARARSADTAYAAAQAAAGIAQAQKGIARSALLPGLTYHNQFLYTQGQSSDSTQSASAVRFVANNAVHEYISQGSATQTIGGASITAYRKAKADYAAAHALLEVARRGLVAATIGNYYGMLAAQAKVVVAQRALAEAERFRTVTQQRERGGEAAHADAVRADLQVQQRQRDLNDAVLAADKARLDLGALLFPDPSTPYQLAANLDALPSLPTQIEVEAAAKANNPDLRAALEQLRSANLDVAASRFGYTPDLVLNVTYGIDAPQFAVHGPGGVRNLGYSASATLDIPLWDWLATHQRVRQSQARQAQARVDLTVTQRRLLASLHELYDEAAVSQKQLALLDESVATATETLRLTNLRYTAGEGTVLEIVDAQSSLVLAESGRTDGLVRYHTALANLQTLTGKMP